ncbi:hypothetical protein BH10ACT7_BH10ACT7_12030 [soil metagenome]
MYVWWFGGLVIDEAYWAQFGAHLSADDLGRVLRRSRLAAYRWLREGIVPGHQISGTWVVFKESVVGYLEDPESSHVLPTTFLASFPEELSVEDVAKMLGLSTKTIYKFLAAGDLPGRRVGGFWVLYKSEIKQRLEQTYNGNPLDRSA